MDFMSQTVSCQCFFLGYRNSLWGPFPQAEFCGSGGVSLKNAAEYLKMDLWGVGIGSSLVKEELLLGKRDGR